MLTLILPKRGMKKKEMMMETSSKRGREDEAETNAEANQNSEVNNEHTGDDTELPRHSSSVPRTICEMQPLGYKRQMPIQV
jgi:hypothetical protein